MQMQVFDGLLSIVTAVGDNAEAAFNNIFALGDHRRHAHQVRQLGVAFVLRVIPAADMLFRDNQHMHGSLRVDIAESQRRFVFIHLGAGDFTRSNFAEKAIVHLLSLLL